MEPCPKKVKYSDEEPHTDISQIELAHKSNNYEGTLTSLSSFRLEKVLNNDSQRKFLAVSGMLEHDNDDNKALVLLEKQSFNKEEFDRLFSEKSSLKNIHSNDIYSTYTLYPEPDINGVKTTIVYPATKKHIKKYKYREFYSLIETAEDYNKITLPYLNEKQFSLQWVYNILEKKAEADRVLYEDPNPETGFVMVPDMKWDMQDISCLYISAIVNKHGLKSIRDLNETHLPLLNNILTNGLKSIEETYGLEASKIRSYFHYQPSYYHLHVHFTHINFDAPGSSVDRARLLTDVINNITIDPNYYNKVPLTFTLKDKDELLIRFREKQ